MRKQLRHFSRCALHPRDFAAYRKFREFTMVPPTSYMQNLLIARKALGVAGAVVECGTWKGGMIAGIAGIFGNRRDYYLFDSYEVKWSPERSRVRADFSYGA